MQKRRAKKTQFKDERLRAIEESEERDERRRRDLDTAQAVLLSLIKHDALIIGI